MLSLLIQGYFCKGKNNGMKKNMNDIERGIRLPISIILLILNFSGIIPNPVSTIVWILFAVLAITSLVGICPLYSLFNINTRYHQNANK